MVAYVTWQRHFVAGTTDGAGKEEPCSRRPALGGSRSRPRSCLGPEGVGGSGPCVLRELTATYEVGLGFGVGVGRSSVFVGDGLGFGVAVGRSSVSVADGSGFGVAVGRSSVSVADG